MTENKKNFVQKLKNYLGKNNITSQEIELPENKGDEMKIADIKSHPLIFAELYIKFFEEFRHNFQNFKDNQVKDIIQIQLIHVHEISPHLLFRFKKVSLGEGRIINYIFNYISQNYKEIHEFFDLCYELYVNDIN